MRRWVACWSVVAAIAALPCAIGASAQTSAGRSDNPDTHDSNPTRPVLFAIRPEIYKVSDEVRQSALIFRYDQASFVRRRWLPGRRGVILRFEVPLARTEISGAAAETGLGDAYGQVLLVPHLTPRFAFVAGTGLLMPTATGDRLGAGKWVLAPAAGPVWFLQRRGMVYLKLQNFVAVAGKDRPHINFMLVTPTFVHVLPNRWWVLADSETRTNWVGNNRTGFKSGLQIGHVINRSVAVWAKPEVMWGADRTGRWNLKLGVVWYRER